MKKIILFTLVGLCASPLLARPNSFNTQVQRRVNTATQQASTRVVVHFKWVKNIHMSDVMSRPPRAEDMVIYQNQTSTTCPGVVSTENRVYFVADCLAPSSFEFKHLQEVQISFANGVEVTGSKRNIGWHNDVAWVAVSQSALNGVPKIPVRHTPKGQSLQEAYGKYMTQKLKSFFQTKHIRARHRCRIGYVARKPEAAAGDPVIIDGNLVALMKYVPAGYLDLWGDVSENSLAIIH